MEELGRADFDAKHYADADVILIDESHNFRNDKANRYLALDTIIQLNGGRGRDGDRKKLILLSATPINNDLSTWRTRSACSPRASPTTSGRRESAT